MTDLSQLLGDKLQENVFLSKYTTIGIGGPAKYFFEAQTHEDLIKAIDAANQTNAEIYILGNGSNILISDKGFEGLVILNLTDQIKIIGEKEHDVARNKITHRLDQPEATNFYTFEGLDYDESKFPSVWVELDSGLRLQAAIYKLISQGITGLEWFAGIPGTIGGGIYMNVHGGTKFISDYFVKARLIDRKGKIREEGWDYFKFNYDYSILHDSGEFVISSVFELKRGDKIKSLKIAQEWAKRKSVQPQRSMGSTFQNITSEQKEKLGFPTSAAGFIIDKILGFKGTKRIGDAIVSPHHANFIENLGNAKASEVFQIIQEIKKKAKDEIGIEMVEEIKYLGKFD